MTIIDRLQLTILTGTHHVPYEHRERERRHVTYAICCMNSLEGGRYLVSAFRVHVTFILRKRTLSPWTSNMPNSIVWRQVLELYRIRFCLTPSSCIFYPLNRET